jgi:membrane fusion protein, heavy metal efflux system
MNKYFKLLLTFVALIAYSGCSHTHDENGDHPHEPDNLSVTHYTDSTELFLEHPPLVKNKDAKFLIHLTDLKNFKPVTQGILTLEFENNNGHKFFLTEEKPSRPGIYIFTIRFEQEGNYKLRLSLNGNQVSDIIYINDIIVYAADNDVPQETEETSASISFLKEQQWKIDFAVEPSIKRNLQGSLRVTGEILYKPEGYSKVVSPLSGIILSNNNTQLKTIGLFVNRGETLINISPSADAGNNILRIRNEFLLSETEFERVSNLYEKKAVSKKRLDEAKSDYELKKSSYNALNQQVRFTENGYTVTAPISGYIEKISFNLGDQVNIGQELYTIINANSLILQANIPSSNFEEASNSTNASFKVEGLSNEFNINSLGGRKVSTGAAINTQNRTIPLYFEFNNPQHKIKVGMYSEVYIKTGDVINNVSIPVSAIIDEDGLSTVYVQLEGESFEKRIIKVGVEDDGFVEVLYGLNEGERVVTKGAYQVRLAALTPESAIGHGHVH